MTQEKLAELLSISAQAVSRWENDAAMPDISLLPPLANLFNVTTDYLLGVDIVNKEAKIKEISKQALQEYSKAVSMYSPKAVNNGIHAAIEILEEGVRLYPDNWSLKRDLINFRFAWHDEDITVVRANQKELLKLCENVLESCADEKMRQTAIEHICRLAPVFHDSERAKELANTMPPMSTSRELLLLNVLEGEELRQMNLRMIGEFLGRISCCIVSLTNDPSISAEEVLELEQRAVDLYRVMYGSDDFSTMYPPFYSAYQVACKLAERGNNDLAFAILEKEYNRMLALSENEYKNISPYVYKHAYGTQYVKYSVREWQKEFLWRIDNDWLPFMRDHFPETIKQDLRYKPYQEKLTAYQKKYSMS